MNMEQQLGINAVIDTRHISYGVGGICARAAHLLMNINNGTERQTGRQRDGGGGRFRVKDDSPRGVHGSGEHDCTFTAPLQRE